MKPIKRKELVKFLKKLGLAAIAEGRHPIFKHAESGLRVPVPSGVEVSPGTLRDIYKLLDSVEALRIARKGF